MSAPSPVVSPELKALLRRVKLGKALDTLPERLTLARTGGMGHAPASSTARVSSGSTRGRLPGSPPPVVCAAAFSSPARRSASSGAT